MELHPPAQPSRPALQNHRSFHHGLYWTLAVTVAAVLLFFSLRGMDWRQVWSTIRQANRWLLLLSFLTLSFSLLLRASRWRVLLQTSAPISLPATFWATSIGYFGNSFLPARAGELLRTLWVSKIAGVSRLFVLTTALSERLCDAIALVLISSVVLIAMPAKPGWFAKAAAPFAVAGLSGAILIAMLPKLKALLHRGCKFLPLSLGLRHRAPKVIDHILTGMEVFHQRSRLLIFAAYTALIWGVDALGMLLGMRALNLPGTLPIALLLMTALGLGSALPSTPGYIGIYQFVAVSVLTPFGFTKADAIAYILLAQVFQYVNISIWGGLALFHSRSLNLRSATAQWKESL
jgi:glycosyltransferase 2 family protein